jgi:hypothetical protein
MSSISGQVARKYSNEFLNIGVGARGIGMGNSVFASTEDVYSTYWNPAGLHDIKQDIQVGYMHSEYFAGIAKYDYGAIAYRINSDQVAGLSFIRFGVDNIPNTIKLFEDGILDYARITTFSVADIAIIGSFAHKFPIENLTLGGNVKIIHRKAGKFANAFGFGFDVAARYKYQKWIFATNIRDVTSTFNAWSFNISDEMKQVFIETDNEIPENSLEITTPRIIAAASYTYPLWRFDLTGEATLDITTDKKRNTLIRTNFISIDPYAGIEVGFDKIIFYRMGIRNLQQEIKQDTKQRYTIMPSIGAGLQINKLGIDYAYTNLGNVSGALYSHIISLRYQMNTGNLFAKKTERFE